MPQEINSLEMLLHEEIKDIYDAEKQLVKALPKMAKAANSDELREALEEHLEVTKEQVSRLEQVFELLQKPAKSKPCKGMRGLIEEGQEVMQEDGNEYLCDAAIIGAAQKVEHYEMAAYGTARTLAEQMGNDEIAELLEQTLEEEKEADEKLTEVSMSLLEAHGNEAESESSDEEETMPARQTSGRSSGRGAGKTAGRQKRGRAA
jgi:ferritin-like metal-binding protein YciE